MRKKMGLFANLRPAKVIPQLIDASSLKKEVIEGVDIMVVSIIAKIFLLMCSAIHYNYFSFANRLENSQGEYTSVLRRALKPILSLDPARAIAPGCTRTRR